MFDLESKIAKIVPIRTKMVAIGAMLIIYFELFFFSLTERPIDLKLHWKYLGDL